MIQNSHCSITERRMRANRFRLGMALALPISSCLLSVDGNAEEPYRIPILIMFADDIQLQPESSLTVSNPLPNIQDWQRAQIQNSKYFEPNSAELPESIALAQGNTFVTGVVTPTSPQTTNAIAVLNLRKSREMVAPKRRISWARKVKRG